jgi:hypothetical protein
MLKKFLFLLATFASVTAIQAETIVPNFHWNGQHWVEVPRRYQHTDRNVGEQRPYIYSNSDARSRSNQNYSHGPTQSSNLKSKPTKP